METSNRDRAVIIHDQLLRAVSLATMSNDTILTLAHSKACALRDEESGSTRVLIESWITYLQTCMGR